MKKFFIPVVIILSLAQLAQAETVKLEAKVVDIKKTVEGGGIGLANSAKLGTEYKAAQDAIKQCTDLGGVVKKNSVNVSEAVCGEVFDFQGFKSRYCSAEVSATCFLIIQ